MWDYDVANAMKNRAKQAKEDAVGESSLSVGVIKKTDPITVSVEGGELMYNEGENLLVTRTVKDYGRDVSWPVTTSHVPGTATREKFLSVGMKVILAPVGGVSMMTAIDILEE